VHTQFVRFVRERERETLKRKDKGKGKVVPVLN
jgi:hypothetical protein